MKLSMGLVGSSGRNKIYSKSDYESYLNKLISLLTNLNSQKSNPDEDILCLVSGGSTFVDHGSVFALLNNQVDELILCLPCEFDMLRNCFDELDRYGTILNDLHRKFSSIVYGNQEQSLLEIKSALLKPNCIRFVGKGFLIRNSLIVQKSDIIQVFTLGTTIHGGSLDTWKKAKNKNIQCYHTIL